MKDINPNIFNIVICKSNEDDESGYKIKISDIEIPLIIRKNIKGKVNINHHYFDTFDKDDYNCIILLIFQLAHVLIHKDTKDIYNFDKENNEHLVSQCIKLLNDDFLSIFLYKIALNKLSNKADNDLIIFYSGLINNKKSAKKQLNDLLIMDNYDVILNKDKKNIIIFDYIQLYFIALEKASDNSLQFYFDLLKIFKNESNECLIIFLKTNEKSYIYLLIQKYIIFIQNFYDRFNNNFDLIDLFDSVMENIKLNDYVKYYVSGIIPLIITYANTCTVNHISLFSLMNKFTVNNSLTLISLLEKMKINFNITQIASEYSKSNKIDENILNSLRFKMFNMLNIFSLDILKMNKSLYSLQNTFDILRNYPMIKRRKGTIIEILDFVNESLTEQIEVNFSINQDAFISLLNMLLSYLIFKQQLRSCFVYSICLSFSNEDYLSNNYTEFGFICNSCNLNICLICTHRCHLGHSFNSLGYSYFQCQCGINNTNGKNTPCLAMESLDIPQHLKTSFFSSILNEGSQTKLEESSHLKSISHTYKDSEKDLEKLIKSPRSNVFIATNCKTVTIQTDNPICQVLENSNELSEYTLYYFETEIIMGGYFDQIAIGLTTVQNYPTNEFAGYLGNSVGYHGDDGKCYVNSTGYSYGVKFGSTDIIGCGITNNGNVYYTHNGCILPLLDIKLTGHVYSIISLRGKYSSVKINHNQIGEKFLFRHNKQKKYKLPNITNFSISTANLIRHTNNLHKVLQLYSKQWKNNREITDKYSVLSNIIQTSSKKYEMISTKNNNFGVNLKKNIFVNDRIDEKTEEIEISPKVNKAEDEKIISINLNNNVSNKNGKVINKEISSNNTNENKCKCGTGKCIIF